MDADHHLDMITACGAHSPSSPPVTSDPEGDFALADFLRDDDESASQTSPGPLDFDEINFTPVNSITTASTLTYTDDSLNTMNDAHSSSNSPTDFAFAAPALPQGDGIMTDPKSYLNHMSPPNQVPFAPYPANFSFHAGSSFSSSGSATGTSFSSADTSMAALPAISRDFTRPSVTETRRPATAGGALVTRPFNMNMEPPIQEEGSEQVTPDHQNAASVAAIRRSSESQVPWSNFGDAFGGMSMLNTHSQPFARQPLPNARPQTSDGVPAASFAPSLPSIGTQMDWSRMPYRAMPEMAHNTFPGDRAYSMNGVRPSYVSPPMGSGPSSASMTDDGSLQFVSLGGPAPKKRPRRRFDEIERLYICGWNGCEKSYGTLNHLNAHVAMQKHGEKRLPTGQYKPPL